MDTLRKLSLLACLTALAACSEDAAEPKDAPVTPASRSPAVAEVNGAPVSKAMLTAYLRARGVDSPTPQQKATALSDLVNLVLLQQQARKTGLVEDPKLRVALHLERVNSVASAMARQFAENHPVSDAEAEARYQSSVKRAGKTEYKLRHILLPSKEQAQAVLAQLNQGADFSELAELESTDQNTGAGGLLGWVTLVELPPSLAKAVKQTSPGSYTREPVQSPYGWHVVKIVDTRGFSPPPFAKVKSGILASMQRQKMQQYLASLRSDANIVIQADFSSPAGVAPSNAPQSDDAGADTADKTARNQ